MPPSKGPTRGRQLVTSGLGQPFTSPIRRRDKKKTTTLVEPIGQQLRVQCLEEKLAKLKRRERKEKVITHTDPPEHVDEPVDEPADEVDEGTTPEIHLLEPFVDASQPPRRVLPDKSAHNLYTKWADVLPSLIDPLLHYITASTGKIQDPVSTLQSMCSNLTSCTRRTNTILCLYQDRE